MNEDTRDYPKITSHNRDPLIKKLSELRKEIEVVLKQMPESRERSIAQTNLDQTFLWIGEAFRKLA